MGNYYKTKITCVTSYKLYVIRSMPEFVNPTQILEKVGLRKTMVAADFGSGSGGWTIPLASQIEEGRVFAIDVQEEPLSALIGKAKLQGISNIKKIVADVEKGVPEIKNNSCDLVLMTDLLFEIDDKTAVFKEANRILKTGGKTLVVDWNPDSSLGPKKGRISQETVKKIAQSSGFQLEKEFKAGDYHYGLVFTKPQI